MEALAPDPYKKLTQLAWIYISFGRNEGNVRCLVLKLRNWAHCSRALAEEVESISITAFIYKNLSIRKSVIHLQYFAILARKSWNLLFFFFD